MRQTVRAIVINGGQLLVMDRNRFGNRYLALPGGAIEIGEQREEALLRELQEEATITVNDPRLVIIEDAGPMYGTQYIYLCSYVSGEPRLDPASPEAKISALGKNLYQPKWLPLSELPTANLLPAELKELLVQLVQDGFPDQPVRLTIRG